jgi:Leucine-rich repeat (LRR) protein
LTKVEQVHMQANQLASLPPEMGNMVSIYNMNMCDNQLTTFPPEVRGWRNLYSCWFYNNPFTSLPDEIGEWASLNQIRIGGAQTTGGGLTTLPDTIGQVTFSYTSHLCTALADVLTAKLGSGVGSSNCTSKITGLWNYRNPSATSPL